MSMSVPARQSVPALSIVTPAFNERENLPTLHHRLLAVLANLEIDWKWLVVDDHSSDGTFEVIRHLCENDPRIRGVRLSRNFGSHAAIACGIDRAVGECVVVLAADLQDPPELIPTLLARWREGSRVVWAARSQREGESAATIAFSRLYYWVMRRIVGLSAIPPAGADFFLADRTVVEALRNASEGNGSIFALLASLGFRQEIVTYDKQARLYGRSGWTLKKKVKLFIESIISFSYLPIRLISAVGLVVALLGFVYAAVVVGNALAGSPAQGWSSLMVLVLVIGGLQMMMMGVLGEYLLRALDAARRRPRYLVEDTTPAAEVEAPIRLGDGPGPVGAGKG
jgi:glycosyltransferase involved in cell wall biosynthesis